MLGRSSTGILKSTAVMLGVGRKEKKKSESNLNEIMHLKKTLKMLKSYTNVSCKCKYS